MKGPEDHGAPASTEASAASAQLSRSVVRGLAGLILFLVLLNVAGLAFELQMVHAAEWILDRLGISSVLLFVFVNDVIISPIPVDIVLVLMSKSRYAEHWLLMSVGFGLISAAAGCADWGVGRLLARTRRTKAWIRRIPDTTLVVVRKYGAWAVALGALSPIPFSLTCWAAGALRIPFGRMFLLSLLRVPRFVIYYLIISASLGGNGGS